MGELLKATISKNDRSARLLIFVVSAVVFMAVVILKNVKLDMQIGFNVHIFATINAMINSMVSILLLAALNAVKKGNYQAHKNLMILSMVLSIPRIKRVLFSTSF